MREEKIKVNEIDTYYKIGGEGTSVLILHGWGSKSDKWVSVGEIILKKGFKVIIPDLPGFGKTEKPEIPWKIKDYSEFILNFVNQLNLKNFILLGHSFGGAVSVDFVVRNENRAEKLFLIGASCIRKKTARKRILFIFAKVFKVFSFIPFSKKLFYKFIVRKSDYQYTKGIMKETYLNIIKQDLLNVLEKIKIPTIIIWGEKDDVVPVKDAKIMNQKINNSKLLIISKGDHDLEQNMKNELASKILNNL